MLKIVTPVLSWLPLSCLKVTPAITLKITPVHFIQLFILYSVDLKSSRAKYSCYIGSMFFMFFKEHLFNQNILYFGKLCCISKEIFDNISKNILYFLQMFFILVICSFLSKLLSNVPPLIAVSSLNSFVYR